MEQVFTTGMSRVLINKITYDIIWSHDLEENDSLDNYFEVDELISNVVSVLNKKLYKTSKGCCIGHYRGDDIYIAFVEGCLPNVIPKGFVVEDDEYYKQHYSSHKRIGDSIAIRKRYSKYNDNISKLENRMIFLNEFIENVVLLETWADKLEEINE